MWISILDIVYTKRQVNELDDVLFILYAIHITSETKVKVGRSTQPAIKNLKPLKTQINYNSISVTVSYKTYVYYLYKFKS